MNDFQKAIDTITKAFEEFAAKLKEMADTLNKAFGLSVPEKEKKKESKLSGSIWDVFEKIPKRIFH